MAVSEEVLREKYRELSDEKLLRLASQDAARLRPEALSLLQQELATRGLAALVEERITAQLRTLTASELTAYCNLLQAQSCPSCWSSTHPLNATIVRHTASFFIATTYKEQFAVACPTCLDKLNRKASRSSALLGWWAIPWGIIRTTQSLLANRRMAQTNHSPRANDSLKAFVSENIEAIDAANTTAYGLQALLVSLLIAVNRTNTPLTRQ